MKTTELTLKSSIQVLYQDMQLSCDELSEIRGKNNTIEKNIGQITRLYPHKSKFWGSALAAACLFIGLASFYGYWTNTQQYRLVNRLVSEVIENHLSHKALVYQTTSLATLGRHFSYLGFMVSHSQYIDISMTGQLMGARHCLILKEPAAQLRYQLDKQYWATVFQVRYDKAIYGNIPDRRDNEKPLVRTQQGVTVSVWKEDDLMFAMARPSQSI